MYVYMYMYICVLNMILIFEQIHTWLIFPIGCGTDNPRISHNSHILLQLINLYIGYMRNIERICHTQNATSDNSSSYCCFQIDGSYDYCVLEHTLLGTRHIRVNT